MDKDEQFDQQMRERFTLLCRAYKAAKYHSEKRSYLAKIDNALDLYLDWYDIQGL